ncbi:Type II secretion system protein G precursor [Rubripirellula tenax]|uniref:Type II secretion system protein G n=1 Tax=Rubripirellula tenax TaxID=2528015 RepID=A0A5C6FE69_9BACT|nr:prepilin-type N-terminal cleavage/methylation domain-containing protein [Rubripirellula tenax]TWU60106.1 Type II secretion system protein G precursor [Rubripirellula tenax]
MNTNLIRKRAAFTLVEILTVIVIIGILAGISIPAITGALRNARNAAIRVEIEGMSQAIESYKLKYGDYPPDFSSWTIAEKHYRRAFPNIAQSELDLLRRLTDDDTPPNDTDFTVAIDPVHNPTRMDRAEALVWALGGFSSDPELPFTGNGGPLSLVGTATPTSTIYQINSGRTNGLFNFKPGQYTLGTVDSAATLSLTNRYVSTDESRNTFSPGLAADLFMTYLSRDETSTPFVYFDSRTYDLFDAGVGDFNGYAGAGGIVRPMMADLPNPRSVTTPYGSQTAALAAFRFMNDKSFQIMSGGLDNTFGSVATVDINTDGTPEPAYFQYPTGKLIAPNEDAIAPAGCIYSGVDKYQIDSINGDIENPLIDNISNFTESTLEAALK